MGFITMEHLRSKVDSTRGVGLALRIHSGIARTFERPAAVQGSIRHATDTE
jgi:hypothetical protein